MIYKYLQLLGVQHGTTVHYVEFHIGFKLKWGPVSPGFPRFPRVPAPSLALLPPPALPSSPPAPQLRCRPRRRSRGPAWAGTRRGHRGFPTCSDGLSSEKVDENRCNVVPVVLVLGPWLGAKGQNFWR